MAVNWIHAAVIVTPGGIARFAKIIPTFCVLESCVSSRSLLDRLIEPLELSSASSLVAATLTLIALAAPVPPVPPAHTPFWQLSPVVQGLPSLHDEPFALTGFEQIPVPGLHVPGSWH